MAAAAGVEGAAAAVEGPAAASRGTLLLERVRFSRTFLQNFLVFPI